VHKNIINPYKKLPIYYDLMYGTFPYEENCTIMEKIFLQHNRSIIKILDVGCGTGSHSIIMSERGYDVTGIDLSKHMIQYAQRKIFQKSKSNIKFLTMDMRKIKLKEKFDAIIVPGAGYCYLLQNSDLENFFVSVKKSLSKGGLLLYEFWQHPKIKSDQKIFAGGKFESREDPNTHKLIIKFNTSKYNRKKYWLTKFYNFYVFDTKNGDLYDTFTEPHVFRTYSINEMKQILSKNGFIHLGFYTQNLENGKLKESNLQDFRIFGVATPKVK